MKDQYRPGDAQELMTRAGLEALTLAEVSAEIERIGGRFMADPATPDVVDTTANALAKRVMESIVEKEVDPFRFVASLQAHLVSYGYALTPGHDDRGVSTYKLVRHGRTEAPAVEDACY